MHSEDRVMVAYAWNAIVIFGALTFLGAGLPKAAIISAFVFVSCLVGIGQRRLLQAGLAVVLVAIAVSLGVPGPEEWMGTFKSVVATIKTNP